MPDRACAETIAAATSFALGDDLFLGPVRPVGNGVPARAIFVLVSAGTEPMQFHGPSARQRIDRPQVQIRVRGDISGFEQGQTDAEEARAALHDAAPPTSTTDPLAGFIDCRVVESRATYLGRDDNGHHEWSFNVELMREEAGP